MKLSLFLSTQRCRWIKSNESRGFGCFCGKFGHLIGNYPVKPHEFPLLGASHWNLSNEGAKGASFNCDLSIAIVQPQ